VCGNSAQARTARSAPHRDPDAASEERGPRNASGIRLTGATRRPGRGGVPIAHPHGYGLMSVVCATLRWACRRRLIRPLHEPAPARASADEPNRSRPIETGRGQTGRWSLQV
jgi:hypothetical protein